MVWLWVANSGLQISGFRLLRITNLESVALLARGLGRGGPITAEWRKEASQSKLAANSSMSLTVMEGLGFRV